MERNYYKITCRKGEFINFPRPLMTAGLTLMKSVFISSAKTVLIPWELIAGMSAADAAILKKVFASDPPSDLASCL